MQNTKRIYYLDVLRMIACFSVIMVHVSGRYVLNTSIKLNFMIGNICDSLSRIGVPIFLMISGALFLEEKYDVKKISFHIRKMILFFSFWSLFYCFVYQLIPCFFRNKTIDIGKIISSLIEGPAHLWYIYLIIGMYLITPLLRLWVNKKNIKYIEYFMCLAFIFSFLIPSILSLITPFLDYSSSIETILYDKLYLNYVSGYTLYFILGWYLNNCEIRHKKFIFFLGILGFMYTIFTTFFLSYYFHKSILVYDYLSFNILIESMSIFLFCKFWIENEKSKKNSSLVNSICKNSLNIYAVHLIFVDLFYFIADKIGISHNSILTIILVFFCTLISSYFFSYLYYKTINIKGK